MPDLPARIGKYRIQRELGRGASAVVYLGFDPFTRRHVAIKAAFPGIWRDPVVGARFRKLFLKEAALAGRLSHPHIVRIFDAVIEDDMGYIVMEHVPGGSLRQHCQPDTLLPMGRVLEVAFKCVQALDYASRMGVIHRDIKPANIMLRGESDIKVTDFGAAQLARGEETRVLGQEGSPAYMSPEQVQEEEQDFRTDMYSLGVTLYELLTGRQPFEAENELALAYKVLHETPPPLRVLRPELPQRLEEIVARMMAKHMAERYASWEALAWDLSALLGHLRLPAAPISDTEQFQAMKQLAFFRDFSDVELWEALRLGRWAEFPPGTVLMKEGNIGNAVFMVAQGQAEVTKKGKRIGTLETGDCFGEMSFIDPSLPRPATVAALSPLTVIKIKAASLRQASENCQLAFNRAFLHVLVRRLASAEDRLSGLIIDVPL